MIVITYCAICHSEFRKRLSVFASNMYVMIIGREMIRAVWVCDKDMTLLYGGITPDIG